MLKIHMVATLFIGEAVMHVVKKGLPHFSETHSYIHEEQEQLQPAEDTLPHFIQEETLLNWDQAVQQTPAGATAAS